MAYMNENTVIFNIYMFILCVIEENMTVVLKMIMHMSRLINEVSQFKLKHYVNNNIGSMWKR